MNDELYIAQMKQFILDKERELQAETFSNKTGGKIKSDVVNATIKELESLINDEDKKD